jgi:hypothetical protein
MHLQKPVLEMPKPNQKVQDVPKMSQEAKQEQEEALPLGALYIPRHCWCDVSGRRSPIKLCGQSAGYYKIFRANADMPTTDPVFMWLCHNHKKSVEKRGYIVHPQVYRSDIQGKVVTLR